MRQAGRFVTYAIGACAAVAWLGAARAETVQPAPAGDAGVRIEARFVDASSGLEAEWGATGQILLPPAPGDPALAPWGGARALASSPSRQSVSVVPGDRAAIRVGRQIPFAGWFQRLGRANGLIDGGVEWREVESLLEIEVQTPAPDRSVRLVLTPELDFLQGRSRRVAAFAELRAEIVLAEGRETRFTPAPAQEEFYRRFFSGYDPLRRVRPVDLLLRATYYKGEPGP